MEIKTYVKHANFNFNNLDKLKELRKIICITAVFFFIIFISDISVQIFEALANTIKLGNSKCI